MKNIARFLDRLLLRAAWWIGSPVHGLPKAVDAYVLPEVALPQRLRFARA